MDLPIAYDVSTQLFRPEFFARLWHIRYLAIRVLVPEATVYKHYSLVPRQNNIRLPFYDPAMKPESETRSMQVAAYEPFWHRILARNAAHHAASGFRVNYIHSVLISYAI
jgi:hypothetical protein